MNVREGLIRSVLSSHLEQGNMPHRTMDVDKVGALGMGAGRLAQLITHWQASTNLEEQALWLRRTWRLLIRRTAKDLRIRNVGEAGRRSYAILERACFQVLMEWANPNCLECAGVGKISVKRYEVDNENKLDDVLCQVCGGDGVKRYSDRERMRALEIREHELDVWVRNMDAIMLEITKRVGAGMEGAIRSLGRETSSPLAAVVGS